MPAGGELAALFARRAKVSDADGEHDDDVKEQDAVTPATSADDRHESSSPAVPTVAAPPPTPPAMSAARPAPGRLPPRSSPPSTPNRLSNAPAAPTAGATPPPVLLPKPAEEPIRVSAQNEELKAKFEERNLEVGIPTPSFLLDVRKNLKKPGVEKTVNGYSSDSGVTSQSKTGETVGPSGSGSTKVNAFKKTTVAGNVNLGKNYSSDPDSNNQKVEKSSTSYVKSDSFTNVGKNHSSDSDASKKIENAATSLSSSSGYVKSKNNFSNKAQGGPKAQAKGGTQKNNPSLRSASTLSSDHDFPVDEKAATLAAAVPSLNGRKIRSNSDTSSKNLGRSNSEVSSSSNKNHDIMAARRSRMVASRGGVSSASAVLSNAKPNGNNEPPNTSIKQKKASPAHLRKEKLLARVKASHTMTTNSPKNASSSSALSKASSKQEQNSTTGGKTNSAISFDASKTSIISPKRDEFEVLFADGDFNFSPGANESIDSIANEMHEMHDALLVGSQSAGSAATIPTNNIHSKVKISMTSTNTPSKGNKDKESAQSDFTPEKSVNSQQARLHNASTPKIRGNRNYRRDSSYDEGRTSGGSQMPSSGNSRQLHSSPKKHRSRQSNDLPSFQEQQQMDEDYMPQELQQSTPRRHRSQSNSDNMPQAYPLRNSPSQLSQMSGITTPSCFPQEFNVPNTGHSLLGHLQQPMLIGGPIHENSSLNSTPQVGIGGSESGQLIGSNSAFSPGMEAENRRLREQLGSMKKKLEEKDAIISQLMKRIGDLETVNNHHVNTSFATVESSHTHVNTSFATVESSHTHAGLTTPSSVSTSLHSAGARSNTDSFALSSLWDQSQPATTTTGSASASSFHNSAFSARSNSQDTESALSIPSSPRHPQKSSLVKAAQHKRGHSSSSSGGTKNSPNTTTTSSTASVTTANSSKSGRRPMPRSKSISSHSSQRSPRRQSQKMDGDRKFVC